MNKIIIAGCAMATAFAAVAMPTKKELAQVQKLVEEATKADLAAFKAGQKTAKEAAESHLALAAKAENQAEKYLYYQGAFKLYARSGEYSRAIDTLETLKRDVKDVTPEVINELVGQELRGVAAEDVARIHGMPNGSTVESVSPEGWSYQVVDEAVVLGGKEKTAVPTTRAGALVIPTIIDRMPVRGIGPRAFAGCNMITSVTISASVTSIGACAFSGCDRLKTVNIPKSVTSIGREAFRWCWALESVTIPPELKVLEHGVFASTRLKSVAVPSKVESIEQGAVAGCTDLAELSLPESVTNIGVDAFRGSGHIKLVTIPSNVKTIADNAFAECKELTFVTMLGERPNVSDNVFHECGNLKEIHVPVNAKSWAGMKEWQGIPLVFDGKETVNGYAWPYWLKDGEVKIASKLGGYSSVLSPAPTGHVVIPSTLGGAKVTHVGGAAFYRHDGMTSVTIPESVTGIDYGAFQRCGGLKSVTIPSGVKEIQGQAFYGCSGLEKVIMLGERPKVAFNSFAECGKLKEIHVPANAKSWAGMKEWQGIPLVFDAK